MRHWLRFVLVLAILGGALAMGKAPSEQTETVRVETKQGRAHTFMVEVADDPRSRARGLMFRDELDRDNGMLFLFPRQKRLSFWMKDTPLPLDIIFIDKVGTIVHIAVDTTPYSLDPISSQYPAIGALEVNAGVSKDLGIETGDVVRHRFFKNVQVDNSPS